MCAKFNIFRYDRPLRLGGGVLIAVSNLLFCERINCVQFENIEFVAVKIKLLNISLFVTCSYIPPNSNSNTYDLHVAAIESVLQLSKPSDIFMAFGDFNLPNIPWNNPSEINYLIPTVCHDFLQSLYSYGLFQVNNVFNPFGKLLDLIFVNQPMDVSVKHSMPVTLPEDRYHPTLDVNIYQNFKNTLSIGAMFKKKKAYCFSRANYAKLNYLLSNVNWSFTTTYNNFDDVLLEFYSVLHHCISKCVPKLHVYNKGPPWNNNLLTNAKNRKNKCFKIYKKSGLITDFRNYSIARSIYNNLNMLSYNNYISRMRVNLRKNPRLFYTFINSKRRMSEYPKYLKFGSCCSGDDSQICNMFADFFATTYSKSFYNKNIHYPFSIMESPGVNFALISNNTVLSNLKTLKSTCSYGPDGIPSCLLKNCAEYLYHPLTAIFNKSIELGYLPSIWKESYIVPLFKSGSKLDVTNYRGIAKLNAIPKLLEKILTDSLSYQLSSIMSTCQHGFCKSRSTITNILEFTTTVNEGFLKSNQTDVIYTDFSKAFDKVNHELLIFKLSLMGFSNSTLKWLHSYLTNRTQKVKFKDAISRSIFVPSGVPQGSHLGPLLFTLFINDLPSVISHSKVLMYADDVKIFRTLNNTTDYLLLQSDIDNLYKWCQINLMELNIKKCKHMSFFRINEMNYNYYINDTLLVKVDNITDLGIMLDRRLNFYDHITMTVNKATGVLGYMKRWSKEFSDPYITKQLYTSLVRPILEYGSIIWDPYYTIYVNKIESVQKQFLLFCLRGLGWNSHALPSYTSRLALIKLPTLKSRRTMLSVTFLLGLMRGDVDSEFLLSRINFCIPTRQTRNFDLINVKYYSSNYANNDPFRRICINFNNCYDLINLADSSDALKRKIILHLNC